MQESWCFVVKRRDAGQKFTKPVSGTSRGSKPRTGYGLFLLPILELITVRLFA